MIENTEIERCNRRRRWIHSFAVMARGVVMVVLTALAVVQMGYHSAVLQTGLRFGGVLVGSAMVIMLLSFVVQVVTYATLAALLTRTPAVKWLKPSQCKGLMSWVGYEWSFYSNGWQRGYRCMGLDVVTSGRL
jgi:hypothetical protein